MLTEMPPATTCVFLLLGFFGASYIVGHSKISLTWRIILGGHVGSPEFQVLSLKPLIPVVGPWLVELLECPACFGFWIGLIFALMGRATFSLCLLTAFAVAGSNFILGRLTRLI